MAQPSTHPTPAQAQQLAIQNNPRFTAARYNAAAAYQAAPQFKAVYQPTVIGAYALNLAQTRYEYGLGNIVELSTAQLNLTAAQIAVTSAYYDYQTQRTFVDYQAGVLH